MINVDKIREKDRLEVLKTLYKIPPDNPAIILTKNQFDYKQSIQIYWSLVGVCLKAYFNGQSREKSLNFELQHNPRYKDFGVSDATVLFSVAREWLDFYNLIYESWVQIENWFEENEKKLKFESPGECLSYILAEIAQHSFDYCLMGYSEYSSKKIYRDYLKLNKIEKNQKKLPLKKSLSYECNSSEQKEVNNAVKYVKRNSPNNDLSEGVKLQIEILECCDRISKNDCDVKDLLERFRKTESKNIKRRLRQARNSPKQEVWKSGKLIKGTL